MGKKAALSNAFPVWLLLIACEYFPLSRLLSLKLWSILISNWSIRLRLDPVAKKLLKREPLVFGRGM